MPGSQLSQSLDRRRAIRLAALAAALAASVGFFINADGKNGYWTHHPFLGSLVSGLVLFAILGLGVEQFLDYREKKKWKQVAALSCHTLGDSGSRPIVTELGAVYLAPDDDLTPFKKRSDETSQVHPVSWAAPLAEASTIGILSSQDLPPLDFFGSDLVPRERLWVLLHDTDWLAFAIRRFQPLRHEIRSLLAPWASIMILSHEPRQLLNCLASLNDDFGLFRVDLEILAQRIQAGVPREEADRLVVRALRWWQLLDARARILTNELWKTAGGGAEKWSYWLPPELNSVSLQTAFSDTGDKPIGDWQPPDAPPLRDVSGTDQ